MNLSQNNSEKFKDRSAKKEKNVHTETIENLSYLYPNGHRITPQMGWFKVSRARDLKSDFVA